MSWNRGLYLTVAVALLVACSAPAPSATAPAQAPAATSAAAPGAAATPAAQKPAAATPAAQAPTSGAAAGQPLTVEQIANYKGPDRQAVLLAGAKKEGTLMVYTSYIVEQILQPMVDAFQKQYPDVKVQYYRADSPVIRQRIETEYQANQHNVDVINDSSSPIALKGEGLLQSFYSPSAEEFPANADTGREPNGYWVNTLRYPRGFVYNTNLVKKEDVIKTWDDLLKPRWKGHFATTIEENGSLMFIGGMIDTRGKDAAMDYLTKLSQQDVTLLSVSIRGVLDQVIAGNYDACLCAVHHTEISKAQGAPVDWVLPDGPVFETTDMVALPKQPAHPYAAMLWIDFLLDQNGGQKVFEQNHYLPRHPALAKDMPGMEGRTAWVLTPSIIASEEPGWKDIQKQLFLKGA